MYYRLLANLTQPAIICFQGELPEEKTNRNFYIETEEHLQLYKQVASLITTVVSYLSATLMMRLYNRSTILPLAKRLAGKNIPEVTCFVLGGM